MRRKYKTNNPNDERTNERNGGGGWKRIREEMEWHNELELVQQSLSETN